MAAWDQKHNRFRWRDGARKCRTSISKVLEAREEVEPHPIQSCASGLCRESERKGDKTIAMMIQQE